MPQIRTTVHRLGAAAIAASLAAVAIYSISADAQTVEILKDGNAAPMPMPQGDADRGAEQFEATCAECHGAAATAPTLRGIIDRPIAGLASFTGYSEGLKAKRSLKWTKDNLNAYMKSPPAFAPGNFMYREFPDAQMRADILAFLETLPPPR
jgi:cytochrome c